MSHVGVNLGEHFAKTEGYQRYAETAALLRQVGQEAAASVALFGSPGVRELQG